MDRLEKIKADILLLSPVEKSGLLDFVETVIEDTLEFTPEFEATIRESEEQMRAGLRPRVRKPS